MIDCIPVEIAHLNLVELKAPSVSCVYFLIRNNRIVYIGQTTGLLARIGAHQRDKVFDRVLYVVCPQDQLLELEEKLILEIRPPLNRLRTYHTEEEAALPQEL